jgi:acid phosphatase type 7
VSLRPDPLRFWCQYGIDAARQMAVNWIEDESVYTDTTAYVRRVGTTVWQTVTGTSSPVHGTGDGWELPAALRHRVIISGLHPGVDYEFRFTQTGETFRIRTLPAALTEPLVAIYTSDDIAPTLMQRCASFDPEFITGFGDFGGGDGTENFVWVREVLRTFAMTLRGSNNRLIPLVVAAGNHDTGPGGGNAPHFQNLHYWHGNNDGTSGLWYELRAGGWFSLIVLDSEHNNSGPLTGDTPQEQWYQTRLAEGTTVQHRQVAWHVAPFPAYRDYMDDLQTRRVREMLCPPAEQAGVRVGFGGHDHTYVRTFRLLHDEQLVPSVVAEDAPAGMRWWCCAQGVRSMGVKWYAEEQANDGVRSNHIFRVTFTPEAQIVESLDSSNQVFHTHVEPANPNAPEVGSSSGRRGRVGDSWGTVARQARQSGSWVGVT